MSSKERTPGRIHEVLKSSGRNMRSKAAAGLLALAVMAPGAAAEAKTTKRHDKQAGESIRAKSIQQEEARIANKLADPKRRVAVTDEMRVKDRSGVEGNANLLLGSVATQDSKPGHVDKEHALFEIRKDTEKDGPELRLVRRSRYEDLNSNDSPPKFILENNVVKTTLTDYETGVSTREAKLHYITSAGTRFTAEDQAIGKVRYGQSATDVEKLKLDKPSKSSQQQEPAKSDGKAPEPIHVFDDGPHGDSDSTGSVIITDPEWLFDGSGGADGQDSSQDGNNPPLPPQDGNNPPLPPQAG